MRDQEKTRSHISSRRRGGVAQEFLDHTTPAASSKAASRYLLDVAATPPPAEEGSLEPLPRLGLRSRTKIDRALTAHHRNSGSVILCRIQFLQPQCLLF